MRSLTIMVLVFSIPAVSQCDYYFSSDLEIRPTTTNEKPSWQLNGNGKWNEAGGFQNGCLSVTGNGKDNPHWTCKVPELSGNKVYRLSFMARTSGSGGNMTSGLGYLNKDLSPTNKWEEYAFNFIPRKTGGDNYIKLGQWHRNDTTYFDNIRLKEVIPVHDTYDGIVLGSGERIYDGKYIFTPQFGYEGTNYSRPLYDYTCGFNSNRWTMNQDSYVIYKHNLNGIDFKSGKVTVNIGYYISGRCTVECSSNLDEWYTIGTIDKLGTDIFKLPDIFFPAKTLYVRMNADKEPSSKAGVNFQIYSYSFTSDIDRDMENASGNTLFFVKAEPKESGTFDNNIFNLEIESIGTLLPGESSFDLKLKNISSKRLSLPSSVSINGVKSGSSNLNLAPSESRQASIPYTILDSGKTVLKLKVGNREYESEFLIPSLYSSSYGYYGSDQPVAWWWCEGTYKVSRQRPLPQDGSSRPIVISAARGEMESFQVVLKPENRLENVTVSASSANPKLTENISIHSVAYHYVHRPTDNEGCIGYWPDALPEWDKPLDIEANVNQPIWVNVKIPYGFKAGDHDFDIDIKTGDLKTFKVSVNVHVHAFDLPREHHLKTAFGISESNIKRYQNLSSLEDRRDVWDKYMQNFRDYRISPYNFAPFDPISLKWTGQTWEGGEIITETPANGKYCIYLKDDSNKQNFSAINNSFIPVNKDSEYNLSFSAKTDNDNHDFYISIQRYDTHHNWISGHNMDYRLTGNKKWKTYSINFNPSDNAGKVEYLKIALRPTVWTDAGDLTGIACFDDIRLTKEKSSRNLIDNGDFERPYDSLKADLDFSKWDTQARKYIDDYRFDSFRLGLTGLGGGTFHSRRAGMIGQYEIGTEQHRNAFKSYCSAIQDHLEENGWLDEAYVYWFDEPDPKDYDFVKQGMDEIKLAGPELQRMLTEEPIEPLYDCVDIWCPVLHNYDAEKCRSRQKEGDDIWWYVCTGPKAPYPTLFIDHNAIDLRMWLWMTWKWQVQGILVWQSNYWNSSAAFVSPEMQNPWTDPMGYVGGYSYPPGHVGYWGNGDGRFIYPPNRDVNNDKSKYLDGPVSSIRWEMLREGIEDFEYFWLLDDLVKKAEKKNVSKRIVSESARLLEIGNDIISDKTHFTKDPTQLYHHRGKVAEAIERLSNLVKD